MDEATIKRLNEINQEFYRVTAENFDATRQSAWAGWEPLLPHLPTDAPLRVLDVGCGNGRFGVFLAQHLESTVTYSGCDSNPVLLARAEAALAATDVTASLEQRDVVEQPPDSGSFGLVALFGVLHHVPGYLQRQQFMQALAARVAPGGFLAFAAWRFYDFERFRARIVPWPDDVEVERHDYLLDWRQGATALRYCHYVDDAEHVALIDATGLATVLDYRADGRTGTLNRYTLLKRETL